jgi:hypothetical protein
MFKETLTAVFNETKLCYKDWHKVVVLCNCLYLIYRMKMQRVDILRGIQQNYNIIINESFSDDYNIIEQLL